MQRGRGRLACWVVIVAVLEALPWGALLARLVEKRARSLARTCPRIDGLRMGRFEMAHELVPASPNSLDELGFFGRVSQGVPQLAYCHC